jgi:tRNA(Ile)-lysidine synthetase-like protein
VRTATTLAYRPGDVGDDAVAPYEHVLVPGSVAALPGGWRLAVEETSAGDVTPPSADVCVLDADALAAPLVARSRRAGDRMVLLGLDGHTSIKRLFIARHVPRALRAQHPVVVEGGGGEIVWVPRCGRSARALVGAATRRVLVVRVEEAPGAAQSA